MIWINGAFGSGKTTAAYELHRRLPGSYVYDPEQIGYFIRRNVPETTKIDDFQDYPMWREMNYSMLRYIDSAYKGQLIIPMTITNPKYFEEIVGKLRGDGIEIHHFVLFASRETLLKRLRSRGEGRNSWAASQIDRCLEGFKDERFEVLLDTDNLSIDEVVKQIAGMSGVSLAEDSRGRMRKTYDRLLTKLKHINLR
ncbi:tunicamycin resistance protein [Paenibacillus sp. CAA11]|uniref:AAA family ATPase n=1 Tax=Paenibacillus sp. CAA11 TaxID=1532905 RepID=UPI000D369922|nr:AAA family ATPase [Paenibacillus sp. CAA11]AWB44525.1 tunicamycin resistance protein [Paenibacillus sp. CAA11]